MSVTFSWDIPAAERLADQWSGVAPVEIGGPAMGTRGDGFEPGVFLQSGYLITSRGCPNHCWFCDAWRRDGETRELPIRDGWNILDDNLLACGEKHIRGVFAMLRQQKERVHFTGGLEAARLEDWHIDLLRELRPKQIFFAYDDSADLEPLIDAGRRLLAAGWTRRGRQLRCYVLIGQPRDSFAAAERRLLQAIGAGFWPMAMLWRGPKEKPRPEWRKFQRAWARPAAISAMTGIADPDPIHQWGLF